MPAMNAEPELLEGVEDVAHGVHTYRVTARPVYGREVTLHVVPLNGSGTGAYVVARTTYSDAGYITRHRAYLAAVREANKRARAYLAMHRKPISAPSAGSN